MASNDLVGILCSGHSIGDGFSGVGVFSRNTRTMLANERNEIHGECTTDEVPIHLSFSQIHSISIFNR